MDLATIDNLQTLKSMAYDQIAMKEQAEQNLSLINQRITQLIGNNAKELVDKATAELPKDPGPTGAKQIPVQDAGESVPTDAPADASTPA